MVITKVTWTPSKTTMEYKTSQKSQVMRKCECGPLDPESLSHLESVGEKIILKAEQEDRELAKAEEAQTKIKFPVAGKTAPSEPQDGDIVDFPEDEEPGDYSAKSIPMHDDTEMPNFSEMEKEHIEWYVGQCTTKGPLIEEVKYNFNQKIGASLSMEKIRERALSIIFKELKIS